MLKFKTSCAVLAYLSSNLLNEVGLSLFRYFEVGLRVCDIVVKKFTFAISSPDEFLFLLLTFYFFPSATPTLQSHWTDVNQTWTVGHIITHLWLLFEIFGPNSPGIYPTQPTDKNDFWTDFELWPNISLNSIGQQNAGSGSIWALPCI